MLCMDYSNEPSRDVLCIDIKSYFSSVEAVKRNIHPLDAYIAVVSRQENAGGLILAASPLVKTDYGIKTGSRRMEIPAGSKIHAVPPRMSHYLKINQEINRLYRCYAADEDLHVYSIDESFLDVTRSHALHGNVYQIAETIQQAVREEFGLLAMIGIGENPLLAKLALDHEAKKKAPYIARWSYRRVPETVWKIEKLSGMWGIGQRLEKNLAYSGITSVRALSQADLPALKKRYGVIGEQLFFHAHGIDRSILSQRFLPESKAFSKSQVLHRIYTDSYELEVVIREMADQVAARLRAHEMETNVVHLSIGFSKEIAQKGFSRQMKIYPSSSSKTIIDTCLSIFRHHYKGEPVQTIGISCGKIAPKSLLQFNLFEDPEASLMQEELEKTVDQIRRRYGYPSLVKASSLTSGGTAIKRATLVGGHEG